MNAEAAGRFGRNNAAAMTMIILMFLNLDFLQDCSAANLVLLTNCGQK